MKSPFFSIFFAFCFFLIPSAAEAHVGVNQPSGFQAGFAHPFFGLGHICAMVAVGLWASQMGERFIWLTPATFISGMALGGLCGMFGMRLPFLEAGIVTSVFVLGVLITAATKFPMQVNILILGTFAIFHGNAHGAEMPENASGLQYAIGFVLATAILHFAGASFGITAQKLNRPTFIRASGLAVLFCGAVILTC